MLPIYAAIPEGFEAGGKADNLFTFSLTFKEAR